MTPVADTECVRSVVILGYPGVQALDLVGPFEVFTGASMYLNTQGRDGYDVSVVTSGGEPATTGTGLGLVAHPLPDPRDSIDTLILPGGHGVDDARRDPDLVTWVRTAAQTVARWLVMYLRRPGGQTQFAAPVWMPRAKRAPIRDVQEAVEAEPGGAHSIPELARRAAMSPRHFTRVFTDEVGEAPGAYVERIRTEAARRQLEETDDTVTVIAARCGFGTAETLRRNFVRRLGISPDQYRRTSAHAKSADRTA
ncbi:GlxA family transcriptional regulator [Mycobacterium sp. IDR2000157661]|uniref:GlxA family transcriptional regulator n=1 Tax=Mycobacterium sp. IDR2000157661 TaxID=2867005 RepID=UPI001EEA35AC|nr:helix-turn-helix domain-containing protein [Mycobacterium sp. IDR2000157661]ULE34124.1 helix-turn-helix domain-containing protein [Mycobacterium sp. IDR2000157661]